MEETILEKLKDWDKKMLEAFITNVLRKTVNDETIKQIMTTIEHKIDKNACFTTKPENILKVVFGHCFIIPIKKENDNITYAIIPLSIPTIIFQLKDKKYTTTYIFYCQESRNDCGWEKIETDRFFI